MKATRKLIPALALLLVSAVLLSTASYAWFTTNTVVKADMTVGVTTPQNLQISKESTNTWVQAIEWENTKSLQPVSSIDGITFIDWTPASGTNSVSLNGIIADGKATISGNAVQYDGKNAGTLSTLDMTDEDAYTGKVYACEMQLRSTINTAIKASVAYDTNAAGNIYSSIRVAIKLGDQTLVFAPDARTGELAIKQVVTTTGEGDNQTTTVSYTTDAATLIAAEGTFTKALTAGNAENVLVYIWYEGNDSTCVAENVKTGNSLGITISFQAVTTG